MAAMGRKRKNDLGLEPRVYPNHGAFFYVHRDGKWEHLGTDKDAANARARLYNDPKGVYGTMVYWLDMFIVDCEKRVALKSTVKGVKLSARTLQDYRDAIGTDEKPGPLRVYFAVPMMPADVNGEVVQGFLTACAEVGRSTRGNRDRACLSSCFSWLLRTHADEIGDVRVNPCMRSSGVKRNPESKRERYVTNDEYWDVWAVASDSMRLLMELTYRTLQRPESDIIGWSTANVITEAGRRLLSFDQNKTGTRMKIALSQALDDLIKPPPGNVRKLHEPLVRRLDGEFYTYKGISSMLRRSIKEANRLRIERGVPKMLPYGFRDLKGKGATDMYYIAKVPLATIQQLLGHANQTTTEIYIKQRWRETSEVNSVVLG
jgi:integrase